jgi:glutaminyl-peptide cyclotransferase
MSRHRVLTVLALSCLACAAIDGEQATPPRPQPAAAPVFDSGKAYEHLRQMVLIGPRPAGSPELRQTRAYITRQISAIGFTLEEQRFTAQTPIGPVEMVNLAVRLPGRRTDRILITGHYDTKIFREFRFVGASDGASSAAILIELARVLKGRPHEFTYEFVWFDGEEAFCKEWSECGKPGAPDNTYGSRHYVAEAKKSGALASIKAMILLDMVGARDLRLRQDTDFSADWLNDLVWATAKRMGHGAIFIDTPGPVGGDDHQPFAEAGIPTIDLINLYDYPQWHTKDDDLAHVAARSLQIVADVLLASLPDIEKRLLQREGAPAPYDALSTSVRTSSSVSTVIAPLAFAKIRSTRSSVASMPRRSSQ